MARTPTLMGGAIEANWRGLPPMPSRIAPEPGRVRPGGGHRRIAHGLESIGRPGDDPVEPGAPDERPRSPRGPGVLRPRPYSAMPRHSDRGRMATPRSSVTRWPAEDAHPRGSGRKKQEEPAGASGEFEGQRERDRPARRAGRETVRSKWLARDVRPGPDEEKDPELVPGRIGRPRRLASNLAAAGRRRGDAARPDRRQVVGPGSRCPVRGRWRCPEPEGRALGHSALDERGGERLLPQDLDPDLDGSPRIREEDRITPGREFGINAARAGRRGLGRRDRRAGPEARILAWTDPPVSWKLYSPGSMTVNRSTSDPPGRTWAELPRPADMIAGSRVPRSSASRGDRPTSNEPSTPAGCPGAAGPARPGRSAPLGGEHSCNARPGATC